jgi:hypothetical protein
VNSPYEAERSAGHSRQQPRCPLAAGIDTKRTGLVDDHLGQCIVELEHDKLVLVAELRRARYHPVRVQ